MCIAGLHVPNGLMMAATCGLAIVGNRSVLILGLRVDELWFYAYGVHWAYLTCCDGIVPCVRTDLDTVIRCHIQANYICSLMVVLHAFDHPPFSRRGGALELR